MIGFDNLDGSQESYVVTYLRIPTVPPPPGREGGFNSRF